MNWFYAFQGQQVGPVEDNELARLVSVGTITGATLVWHSGMPNWLPYAQTQPPAGAPGPGAPPFAPYAGPVVGEHHAQCSQCGIVLPTDEIVRVEDFNVCGACKPILLQKLRQGVSPAVGAYGVVPFRYAGFWIRFAALLLDGLIMSPVTVLIAVAAYFIYPAAIMYNPDVGFLPQLIYQVLAFTVSAAYSIFFVGRYGATPGKMVCELRVVRADGSRLTYGRATGRFFALLLNYFTLYIGFIIAGFDSEKRALHDYVADTRVIYK